MADTKISELSPAVAIGGNEETPVVQGSPAETVRTSPRAIAVYALALPRRPLTFFGG